MVAAAEERLAESAGIGQRPERAGEDGRVLGSLERGPAAGVVIRCSEVVSHFSLTHGEPLLPRKLRRVFAGTSRSRPGRAGHGRADRHTCRAAPARARALVRGRFRWWWQVLGSNQRRLSRRFYIPEGAGRGQGVVCPFFFRFRAGVRACRKEGRGQGGAPGWTNDLDAGLSFRLTLAEAGNGIGLGGWRAPCAVRVLGKARGCVHPFGGARGWLPRGHGAGSRAGSGINQTGGRPAGASKTGDHALPASGPAHPACRAAVARDRTWPSRMA
jgi:hypothetical protein